MARTENPLLFGGFPEPSADVETVVIAGQRLEKLGYDLAGIQDHPYLSQQVDSLTLIAALVRETRDIRFLTDVANLPLRPPAMLAKAASTIDRLSGGRFELGLGAGASWDAVAAMGGDRRAPGAAVDALEEAIQVIRLLWSHERSVTFDGRHYRVAGLHPGPPPAHDIGIWVGGYGDRMMRLIADRADGWLPSSPYLAPDALPAKIAILEDGLERAGRSREAVRRIYNITGRFSPSGNAFLDGPSERWIDDLGNLVDLGIDGFILWARDAEQADEFATEVIPSLRGLGGDR